MTEDSSNNNSTFVQKGKNRVRHEANWKWYIKKRKKSCGIVDNKAQSESTIGDDCIYNKVFWRVAKKKRENF